MFGRIHIAYKWVKVYTWLLAVCAFLGNDFLKFSVCGFPLNPYRALGLAAPAVLLLAPAEFWRTLWRGGARHYALFVGLLCGYALLSWLWVADPVTWRSHTLFLLYGGMTTCLIVGCLDSREAVTRALRLFVLCAAVVALGALTEILSGHYWFNAHYVGYYLWAACKSFMGLPLPVFTMGNVNDFGAYLFFALAAVLWLASEDRGGRIGVSVGRVGTGRFRWGGGYAPVALLFLFLILCTQSRSVFLALILAGAVGFGCFLLRRPPHWKAWLGVACGLLAVAVAGFVWFWLYDASAGKADHSDAVRLGVVRNAWLFYKPVWYRGLGWGGIDYYNLQYPVYTVGDVPHLHNWFLEIWFSCGLFVFLYYMWVYLRTWRENLLLVVKTGRWRVAGDPERGGNPCDPSGRPCAGRGDVWRAGLVVAVMSGFVALSVSSSSFVPSQWFWTVGALGFGTADAAVSGAVAAPGCVAAEAEGRDCP